MSTTINTVKPLPPGDLDLNKKPVQDVVTDLIRASGTVATAINAAEDDIDALDTRLTTAESDIDTLESGALTAATQADMEAESSSSVAVTPAVQTYAPGVAKAWALVDTPTTVSAGYNVASVAENAAGDYTVTFDNAFSSANYVVVVTAEEDANWFIAGITSRTTTAVRIQFTANLSTASDPDQFSIAVFGDL